MPLSAEYVGTVVHGKPADTLNIKINYLTFTTCSANNRINDRSWGIIHSEILYIIMMSSIMATISQLLQLLRIFKGIT